MPGASEIDRVGFGLEQLVDLRGAIEPLEEGVDRRPAEQSRKCNLLVWQQCLPTKRDHLMFEECPVDLGPHAVRQRSSEIDALDLGSHSPCDRLHSDRLITNQRRPSWIAKGDITMLPG